MQERPYIPPAEQNATFASPINRMLWEEFSDPLLWNDAEREYLGSVQSLSGLVHPKVYGESDTSRYILSDPSKTWFAAAYGLRIAPDPLHPEDNGVVMQVGSLETMERVHNRLAETVLQGEHAHVSVLITPPEPELGIQSVANNKLWLSTIAAGKWPVMATGRINADGSPEYFSHDYADYHTGNMVFFPREIQDLISTAAQYELDWHTKVEAGEETGGVLRLRGDDPYDDPYASGFRGATGWTNGIDKIDNISDVDGYFPLLLFATGGESGAQQTGRLAEAFEAAVANQLVDPSLKEFIGSARAMRNVIIDILNFNTRHALGRNITPEEASKAMSAFWDGLARIADKINGRPASSTDDAPAPSPARPEPEQPASPEAALEKAQTTNLDGGYSAPELSKSETPKQVTIGNALASLFRRILGC